MSVNNPSVGEQEVRNDAMSDKSAPIAIALGILLSPAAYLYVGKTKLAIINLLTLNYLMLGVIAVPIHVYKMINDASP